MKNRSCFALLAAVPLTASCSEMGLCRRGSGVLATQPLSFEAIHSLDITGAMKVAISPAFAAEVKGSGDAFYKGNPTSSRISIDGSGDVRRLD